MGIVTAVRYGTQLLYQRAAPESAAPELIILNLYGTIAPKHGQRALRRGFREFCERYQTTTMVLATDEALKVAIEDDLEPLGLKDRFRQIYTWSDQRKVGGDERKDLARIINEFPIYSRSMRHIRPEQAVFISSEDRDRQDAQRDGVSFIHVPGYDSPADDFSFTQVQLENLPRYRCLKTRERRAQRFSFIL